MTFRRLNSTVSPSIRRSSAFQQIKDQGDKNTHQLKSPMNDSTRLSSPGLRKDNSLAPKLADLVEVSKKQRYKEILYNLNM